MTLPPPIEDQGYLYGWSIRHQCRVLIRSPEGAPVVGDRSGAEPERPRPRHPLGVSLRPEVRRRYNLDGGRCPCGAEMTAAELERARRPDPRPDYEGAPICSACAERDDAKARPVFPSPSICP